MKVGDAAEIIFKRFGRYIMPVLKDTVQEGMRTNKYGKTPSRFKFVYTKPVTLDEWKEHAKLLRTIGVPVPRANKADDWEFWEMMPDADTPQS